MSELKTLKDIMKLGHLGDSIYISKRELKQEAIKWIKEYKKELNNYEIMERTFANIEGRVWSLKNFLNITSDDLNSAKDEVRK